MLLVPTEIRPSPIHGIGVFLLQSAKKGELVWRFDSRVDRIYTDSEIETLPNHIQDIIKMYSTWHEQTRTWIFHADHGRHFNHSKQPSTVPVKDGCVSFADIIAARDLPAGEELTSDYFEICDMTRKTGQL